MPPKYKRLQQVGEGAHGVVFKAVVVAPETKDAAPNGAAAGAGAGAAAPKMIVLSGPTPTASPADRDRDRVGAKRKQPDGAAASEQKAPKHQKDGTGVVAVKPEADAAPPAAASPPPRLTAAAALALHGGASASASDSSSSSSDLPAGTIVAIKKIRMRQADEGLSMEAIREIKMLIELNHPYVIRVFDIFNANGNVNVVMEYMDTDLEHIIKAKDLVLSPADIKQYMRMLLLAVDHCHKHWVLHRDLKPGNLLVTRSGAIKLADFGLAKFYGSPDRDLSAQACTLWYRAPELLFGAKSYGTGADMWSVGCVFAELMLRVPLFPGVSEIDQLSRIFACLGSAKEEDWPGLTDLPGFIEFESAPGSDIKAMFQAYGPDALSLLRGFFVYNPSKRLTAAEALEHPYFRVAPAPTPVERLPVLPPKPEKLSVLAAGAAIAAAKR